jgi:hypothetical protein
VILDCRKTPAKIPIAIKPAGFHLSSAIRTERLSQLKSAGWLEVSVPAQFRYVFLFSSSTPALSHPHLRLSAVRFAFFLTYEALCRNQFDREALARTANQADNVQERSRSQSYPRSAAMRF